MKTLLSALLKCYSSSLYIIKACLLFNKNDEVKQHLEAEQKYITSRYNRWQEHIQKAGYQE